jgi:hypothetical protein
LLVRLRTNKQTNLLFAKQSPTEHSFIGISRLANWWKYI